jgi:hypothetical protein
MRHYTSILTGIVMISTLVCTSVYSQVTISHTASILLTYLLELRVYGHAY